MYTLGNVPNTAPEWIVNEFRKLQEALNAAVDGVVYTTLYVAPKKPREGLTVKADGVSFNPGAGAGLYQYRSGAWVLVG